MAKTTTNPFTQTIKNPVVTLVPATLAVGTGDFGTNPSNTVLFATAGAEGAIIKSIQINSTDTAAKTLQFFISPDGTGTAKNLLFTIAVPANSGNTTVVQVDALTTSTVLGLPVDQSGRPVLPLEAGTLLYVGVTVAVTASKTIFVVGVQEDF